MAEAYCSNCGATISVSVAPPVGTHVRCLECHWKLEVISTDPFDVDFPYDYWRDEDEDGDED